MFQQEQMNNTYFALRHGTSTANEEGIVVSDPANGVPRYGLSEAGRVNARSKLETSMPPFRFRRGGTLVFSSDFRRASETAEIFCELGDLDPARLDARLRERNFGELELQPAGAGYETIWAEDQKNPDHHLLGSESSLEVAARVQTLIDELEEQLNGQTIVLVSHGDTLQITQALFRGMEPHRHRELSHLENAELRRLDQMT